MQRWLCPFKKCTPQTKSAGCISIANGKIPDFSNVAKLDATRPRSVDGKCRALQRNPPRESFRYDGHMRVETVVESAAFRRMIARIAWYRERYIIERFARFSCAPLYGRKIGPIIDTQGEPCHFSLHSLRILPAGCKKTSALSMVILPPIDFVMYRRKRVTHSIPNT